MACGMPARGRHVARKTHTRRGTSELLTPCVRPTTLEARLARARHGSPVVSLRCRAGGFCCLHVCPLRLVSLRMKGLDDSWYVETWMWRQLPARREADAANGSGHAVVVSWIRMRPNAMQVHIGMRQAMYGGALSRNAGSLLAADSHSTARARCLSCWSRHMR